MPVGLYLSRCRGRVDETVDLDALIEEFKDRAVVARVVDDLFEPATAQRIERDITDAGLDAVVLAGNSRDHYVKSLSGRHFWDRIVDAGVNPNRVVTANLLEQVALAHSADRAGALAKARAAVSLALLDAGARAEAVAERTVPRKAVLILGATIEGVVAAQRLLQLGYRVHIIDRGDGVARLAGKGELSATVGYVLGHPDCDLANGASIQDADGWVGDIRVTLAAQDGATHLHVGGILIAEPSETAWVTELRDHFRIDVDDEGHARSVNPQAHPAETIEPGIAVVPPVVGEGGLRDLVSAADSAAMALILQLSYPETTHYAMTSSVDDTLCGACASCVKTCAFGACLIDPVTGLSKVDVRRCRGCGKCVVGCPVGARDILSSPHEYLLAAIDELSQVDVPGPKVLGFLCGGCGYPAADRAGELAASGGEAFPSGFLPLRIPCGGRLDTLYVLAAFRAGFDGVTVFRCREGHCHNVIGNLDMDRRMSLLRTVIRSRGLDADRLRVIDISPTEGDVFTASVNGVFSLLGTLVNGKGGPL
ncbi:MAG: hydrogenase iron-sulfur subunit [Coriobacteriia bacterium]|nr:hydrogenase iron-sulfur subunit [Coriobacteriia bacterium]